MQFLYQLDLNKAVKKVNKGKPTKFSERQKS